MGEGERERERLVDVLEVRCDKERDAQSVLSVLLTVRRARFCFTAGLFFISLPVILLLLLLFITHSCVQGSFAKWKRSFSCNANTQALINTARHAAAALLGSRTSRLRVEMSEKQLQHLSWGRCLKRFQCFFPSFSSFFFLSLFQLWTPPRTRARM